MPKLAIRRLKRTRHFANFKVMTLANYHK